MANIIDDALDRLTAELATVLPDRTTGEPRTEDVGPAIWVELPTLTPDRVVGAKQVLADFPVWITADGADRAQVAFLNDAVAKVWDACFRLRNCWPASSRPVDQGNTSQRTVVVTVRMLLAARGFCLPDPPDPAPIPPEPIA